MKSLYSEGIASPGLAATLGVTAGDGAAGATPSLTLTADRDASFPLKFWRFRLRTEMPRQIRTLRTARMMTGARPVVVSGCSWKLTHPFQHFDALPWPRRLAESSTPSSREIESRQGMGLKKSF
jgi:hypothetical protein